MTREQFIFQVKSSQKEFRRFLTALCCGDTPTADDIAQDSYLKAYQSLESLDATDKFRQWLFRIGINTFISHKRSERPSASTEDAVRMPAAETADASFRYQALYAALDRLMPVERSAILLYYMEGYSIKEISDITLASVDAVKQQLSRGRTHLRNLISYE